MRRPSASFLILLFVAFALLTVAAASAEITDDEARLLWIVRDPERVEPAAIGDTARLLVRNFRAMLDRAETRELPLAAPLDVWTTLAGGSVFAARLAVLFGMCVAASLIARFVGRRNARRAAALGGFVLLFSLAAAASAVVSEWMATDTRPSSLVPEYIDARPITEPVITLFRDDSQLGYYHARVNLRRGIGIDLGWRTFTIDEVEHVIDALRDEPVWVVGDGWRDMAIDSVLRATGRTTTWCFGRSGGTEAQRYEFANEETTRDIRCSDS